MGTGTHYQTECPRCGAFAVVGRMPVSRAGSIAVCVSDCECKLTGRQTAELLRQLETEQRRREKGGEA